MRRNLTQRRNSVCHSSLFTTWFVPAVEVPPVMLKQAQTDCDGEQQPIGNATQPPVCIGP